MNKILKRLIFTVLFAGIIALIILLMIYLIPVPPADDVNFAMETLSRAGKNKADIYSTRLFAGAKADYDSAMANWKRENGKFIYFRNFDKVEFYAKLSAQKASEASENSQSNSNALKIKLKDKIDSINKTALNIDKLFTRYPMSSDIRRRISKGNILLREGEVAYDKGQYLLANTKITESENILIGIYNSTIDDLKDYFKSFSKWKQWTQSAINESKKNKSYSIIVDKFSRKCFIYLSGEKKFEFEAELGKNWVGDKRRMGDLATPEGMYKVVNKFSGKDTEYYKSLSLDYPNSKDKERFKSEMSKGTLPAWAKIGGGIEIHGGGGKGVDWTEGCIALTDSEIDLVFNIAKVGTPVTIVGSTKNIDQILAN